ncbi:SLC13 family permease [Desulfosporosinus sp. PR]|uniref:SLC13 family permease n=1 Tax=Candidatus Desulfosporosinus nitrosoreducens TaxID=3401928 RepID=UPI0027F21513|nr:SLC13 family permease [Desulfosporosinus sp. PR]MDQ7096535.1 SLC13 family permease [Desulfosporosinus sp. PR]
MSNTAVLWSCLIAIGISIAVTYKWKVNLGFMAMSFAFLIGCMFQGDTVATVFGFWPNSIVFFLIAACLLFGFAAENGTMKMFGDKLLWRFRKNINFIPILIFLVAMLLGFLGAGSSTMVIVTPIAYSIGIAAGVDPMLIVFGVGMGYITGGYNPWTGTGVIMLGLIEKNAAAVGAASASQIYMRVWLTFVIKQIIFMAIFYVFYNVIKKKRNKGLQGNESREIKIEKPADYTPVQKKTLILILISCLVIVIPSLVSTWFHPKGWFFTDLVNLCKPQAILVIAAVIANIMKLADPKKVINRLPMGAILMIVGVSFLMGIATKAGLLDVLVSLFKNEALPAFLVAPLLSILASFLTIFTSANFVVAPLLFSMVPALSAAMGLNPVGLYASIMIGADATSISPFSDAGAQLIAFAPDELKDRMVTKQFGMVFVVWGMCALAALLGLWSVFPV